MRLDRHLRSFVKGATGAGTAGDGAVLPTPAEVKARATSTLKRVLLLEVAWFGCFIAGAVLVLETAWHNNHLPALCNSAHGAPILSCGHHSFVWPLLLVVAGTAGLFITGYVATRLAVKYLGAGAVAFLRGARSYMGPMGSPPDGQDGGGFPRSQPGAPPRLSNGPQPPELPSSPSDGPSF